MRFLFRLTILFMVAIAGLTVLGHISSPSSSPCLNGLEKASSSLVSATGKSTVASAQKPTVLSDLKRGAVDTGRMVRDTYRFFEDLFHHRSVVAPATDGVKSAVGAGEAGAQVTKSVVDQPGVKSAGHQLVTAGTACVTTTTAKP